VQFGEKQLSQLEAETRRLIIPLQPGLVSSESAVTAAPGAGEEAMATAVKSPLQTVVDFWDTIPGIDELTASTLVYGSIPQRGPRRQMGGDLSWEQGKRGEASLREDT